MKIIPIFFLMVLTGCSPSRSVVFINPITGQILDCEAEGRLAADIAYPRNTRRTSQMFADSFSKAYTAASRQANCQY